jgi:energy-coupling factor transporter ATP-binding protein EcfA2
MEVEVRVAVAPGAYNESIVLRILNPEGLAVDFEKLGIEPKLFKVLEREIAKPNGLILTTGPTGSGKTTTLYSFLKKIYSPEIKIITIEDPIEYHLEGITQEQVSHEKGFDFLAGLRAALRQDPDVIMVGEIRDKETATIAINASLTGHMVFSTLHTNNAAGTIPRLLDLGVQPGILAAALTVSIAQRLVRRLCPNCKKEVPLIQEKQDVIRAVLRNGERIGKDFASYNLRSDMEFKTYEPVGCDQCGGTGFKGRVGLFEAIITDDVIAKVMAQVPAPTERDIKKAAEHQQIFTMIEDGVIKILTGATSFDEIQTVVDLSEDVSGTTSAAAPQTTSAEPAPLSTPTTEQEVSLDTFPVEVHPSGEEIALLIDYLKLLESQQQQHPSTGIADKIARAQHMIISILENTPNLDALFSQKNPSVMVRDEIENLIKELQLLEQDQIKNPSTGIASQIASIRNNIQNMTREVVK